MIQTQIKSLLDKLISREMSGVFLIPPIERNSVRPLKISFFGTCQFELMVKAAGDSRHRVRHLLMGSFSHSAIPEAAEDDDLIVVNISVRQLLSEASGQAFPASDMLFARLRSSDDAKRLIDQCELLIAGLLARLVDKHKSKNILVMSFFEPSFNYVGYLQDRYSAMSPVQIIRKLNEALSEQISTLSNCRFFDINDILNYVGKEFLQDDIVLHGSHASFINDWSFKLESKRKGVLRKLYSAYIYQRAIQKFTTLFLQNVEHVVEVLEQRNPIKLIVCDLDDTLWRGVAAEADDISDNDRIEGWPLGLVEALLFFKARGGILALCSKNEEAQTRVRFERIFRGAISFDDFAVAKVNWTPKSQNIAEILKETNLLAKNCLFIDDNVRETSEVRRHHPEIRCLGTDFYNWRRTVLRSPETQTPFITAESLQRTELVRATAERQAQAAAVGSSDGSRQEWLQSLNLKQAIHLVSSHNSKYYKRALELINKTNQFNTTGKRWADNELQQFLAKGGLCLVSSLRDDNVDNGIISVCLINKNEIVQMVLSCRVFGLGAEVMVGAKAVEIILKNYGEAYSQIVDTGRNATCHNYFTSVGFDQTGDRFKIDRPIEAPAHIMELTS